jgi:hypothetical protein
LKTVEVVLGGSPVHDLHQNRERVFLTIQIHLILCVEFGCGNPLLGIGIFFEEIRESL